LLATLALVSCTLLKPLPTAQALLAEIAVTSLSPSGRGLMLVEALAATGRGKIMWALVGS
jgi:hypothetical protein